MARKPDPTARQRRAPAQPAPEPFYDDPRLNWFIIAALFIVPFLFYGKYLFNGRMLFGTDLLGAGGLALRWFMKQYVAQHGWIAYWLPGLLGGQPTGAAFYGDLFYPTMFARMLLPVDVVWTWTFILHVFAAGLGTYLFLREFRVAHVAAGLAGLGYMLSGSLLTLTYAGHDGRLIGSALLPFALFFLRRGMTRQRFVWFALMGLVVALQLLSGHIQKVYYTGLVLVAFFIFEFVQALWRAPRGSGRTGLGARLALGFLVGLGLAAALSAIQYLPIYGNMPYASRGSERGYAFASSWSMPVFETFDLLTPKFSGGLDSYWSKNPFKLHSEYLGLIPLLFAAVAVLRRWRDRNTRFFTFSFAAALLMAWGGNTPFYRLPYYLLPGISKFRGPAMIFFVAAFSLVVLAGLGIDHFLREVRPVETRKTGRAVLLVAAIPALVAVVFAAFREPMTRLLGSATDQAQHKLQALTANYPSLVGGLFFGALIAAVGALLAWALVTHRLKPQVMAAVVAPVMILDIGLSLNLWNESRGYIRSVPRPGEYYAPDEVTAYLKTDTSLYRVLPLNYERSDDGILLINGIQSTGGQIPNPLQSYQEFIGAGPSVMFAAGNLLNRSVMNVANAKYIITYALPDDVSQYDERSRQTIAQLKAFLSQPQFELVLRGQRHAIYRNREVLPRAFLASGFEVMKDKDALLGRLMSPGFDPTRTALLHENPGFTPSTESLVGSIAITSYDANRIRIRASASAPCLAVLSENFQPDYRATIDAKPVTVLRAFHTLRAVPLPAGDHELVFEYRSAYYRVGTWLSLAALLFLLVTLVLSAVRARARGPAVTRSETSATPA